jgi:acetyl-CoA synthetase
MEQQPSDMVWQPDPGVVSSANLTVAMRDRGFATYDEFHEWSVGDRDAFWDYTITRLGIVLRAAPASIVASPDAVEAPGWLIGAELNIVESCFAGDAESAAIWFYENGEPRCLLLGELRDLVQRVAGGLIAEGIGVGDRVAIAMPMTVESVVAYLAVIWAGAVVVSIADSFAPDEIRTRLAISRATTVITQDVARLSGVEHPMLDKVIEAGAERAIVVQTGAGMALRPGDLIWMDLVDAAALVEPVAGRADDYINILFSSGTTGDPKAIPWTQIAPIKAAMYDGAPMEREFGQFVERAGVTMLGVVPSLVASWRATGAVDAFDWSAIRVFSSTGEASNPSDMAYLMALGGGKPIIEYCGGTEIAGGYLTGTVLQPGVPSQFTTPALGIDVRILDDGGNPESSGEMFLVPPSIGMSETLLNRNHHAVYYADAPVCDGVQLRRHGDHMEKLATGNYRAHGRVDDTMNLGGIKVSSAEIERVASLVPGVSEAAAVAVEPRDGGPSRLVVFTVVGTAATTDAGALRAAMQAEIRGHLNPLFKIHDVVIVDELPRTASNKVMRRVLRERYRPL